MFGIVVARQPIYDRALEIRGYEILYRAAQADSVAMVVNEDEASAKVLQHAFLDIGIDRLVGDGLAFVNLTRKFLVGEIPLRLPADRVVVEVLEDIVPDAQVVEGLRELSRRGYRIALDDYVCDDPRESLLEFVDVVKLDCQVLGPRGVADQVKLLKPRGIELLAEKVETRKAFRTYRDMGIDSFQGFFLTRPEIVAGNRIPANRTALLRLLAQVNDPNVEIEELGTLIEQDVSLAYGMLRYANSALLALPRSVESVREVIVLLGLEKVRALVSLLLMTRIDDRPKDLVTISLVRAKMCELLADGSSGPGASAYFTAGLFSTLEALVGAPMPGILEHLPVTEEIGSALLGTGDGKLSKALEAVLAYEHNDLEAAQRAGFSLTDTCNAFLGALEYCEQTEKAIGGMAA